MLNRTDCTHLMFIDADISFNPQDVLALLALDKDIIGMSYAKKSLEFNQLHKAIQKNPNLPVEEYENLLGSLVFNAEPGTEKFLVSEPLKVMDLGTGFMMIKRSVFERFKEAYPELAYLPDHCGTAHFSGDREIHAFFDCIIDPVSRRYLSEDYTFNKRCRDIGISSWMCPWGNLVHHGNYAFKGNLAAMAQHLGSTS